MGLGKCSCPAGIKKRRESTRSRVPQGGWQKWRKLLGERVLPNLLAWAVGTRGTLFCVAVFTMEQLSSANTRFALDLFLALSEHNPAGNIFISPFSISSAMAMVFLGTRGNTAAQLSKVSRNDRKGLLSFHLPTNGRSLWKGCAFELLQCVFKTVFL